MTAYDIVKEEIMNLQAQREKAPNALKKEKLELQIATLNNIIVQFNLKLGV